MRKNHLVKKEKGIEKAEGKKDSYERKIGRTIQLLRDCRQIDATQEVILNLAFNSGSNIYQKIFWLSRTLGFFVIVVKILR